MSRQAKRTAQQKRGIGPMLLYFWPTVFDVAPTLGQRRVNVSCFLGVFHVKLDVTLLSVKIANMIIIPIRFLMKTDE